MSDVRLRSYWGLMEAGTKDEPGVVKGFCNKTQDMAGGRNIAARLSPSSPLISNFLQVSTFVFPALRWGKAGVLRRDWSSGRLPCHYT